MKNILKWAVISFIALIVLGVIFGGKDDAPEIAEVTQETEVTQQVEEEKPVVKQWVSVVELKGNADKSSDTFRLTGGKARINYSFTGNTVMIGAIYVLREGTSLMEDGGIPEVMVTDAGEDSTIIRKSAGDYYLQVSAANSSYTVTLEEEK